MTFCAIAAWITPTVAVRHNVIQTWPIARTTAQPQVFPFLLALLLGVSVGVAQVTWRLVCHAAGRKLADWFAHGPASGVPWWTTHLPRCLLIFCHSRVLLYVTLFGIGLCLEGPRLFVR